MLLKSQLLIHFEELINAVGSGKNADVIYLDFSKAFDKVDFNILLHKLSRMGIRGNLYKWLEKFLTGRKQCVTVNGVLSAFVEVLSGVPQGSVLGPLLFIIMMKDIDENIMHATIKSFADDTRATLAVQHPDDMVKLQNDLNKIYRWAESNNLEFNDLKFEVVQYGDDEELKSSHLYVSSSKQIIQSTNTVKDLGVLMSSDCSFKNHIQSMVAGAKSVAGWALRTFKTRSPHAMLTLWKSMVLPKLEYCSQLWCPTRTADISNIEEVQRTFVRKICFSTPHNLNYWERLASLGLYSLERRRERYRILYAWKVLENLVPNISSDSTLGIQSRWNLRTGRTCVYPSTVMVKSRLQSIHEGSFVVHGSKLFNCLPKAIRNMSGCSINIFKNKLDSFLQEVPDEPVLPGYTGGNQSLYGSNSLLHILPNIPTQT